MLSAAQHEAVKHGGGPLLVIGGAGTGKTTTLVERFAWLAERPGDAVARGEHPRAHAGRRRAARADRGAARPPRLRGARGHDLPGPVRARCCTTRRSRPASTRSPRRSPPADRLAMLLERIDELPLRHHDLRGNPSAVLGSIVGRIDRLKDELVTCEDYAAWASTLGEAEGARAAREREFGELFRAHDRMLARRRDARLRRPRAARVPAAAREAARARAAGRPLPARARRRPAGHELRPGPAAAAARRRPRRGHRGGRRRPVDPPLPRRVDEGVRGLRGGVARGARRAPGGVLPRRRADRRRGRGRHRSRCRGGSTSRCARGPARRARSRSGPARPSARRRRPSRPRSSG